mgnify:CR=1 FL=1
MYTYTVHCMNGVFQRDKRVTVDERLKNAPYAQAGWRNFENGWYFMSYASLVFKATRVQDSAEFIIEPMDVVPAYSRTTSRQTTQALKELGYTPQEIARIKTALNDRKTIRI